MKCFSILVFVIVFFVSCGYEENGGRGENVVLGAWDSYYNDTDSLLMTRVFTVDYYSYFIFAEGKSHKELNKQSYSIIDGFLLLDKYTQAFAIDADTLWITNSSQDQITKYIRNKNIRLP